MNPFDLILVSVLDLILGDPEHLPHPVRWIGKLINILDNILRGNSTKWAERLKGALAALLTIGITFSLAYICINLSQGLKYIAWIYLGYVSLSVRDLYIKAKDINKELLNSNIPGARQKLSKIVGRDTHDLPKDKIITAAIESIAESTNDGIIAPLFYLIIGGPVLGIIYKAINTLDSMIGHKDTKYLHFGWFSARLDDLANYIPSRICGILIASASLITGNGLRNSLRVLFRDGRNHSSPNSGIPEAAMAGALNIRLGGPGYYDGELEEKPFIGDDRKNIDTRLINKAITISLVTFFLGLILGVLSRWMIMAVIYTNTAKTL